MHAPEDEMEEDLIDPRDLSIDLRSPPLSPTLPDLPDSSDDENDISGATFFSKQLYDYCSFRRVMHHRLMSDGQTEVCDLCSPPWLAPQRNDPEKTLRNVHEYLQKLAEQSSHINNEGNQKRTETAESDAIHSASDSGSERELVIAEG
eukprot:CAMPEP_0184661466 /NCGR_PEP_ID=MMETSP0308-20130426/38494_1 /TAXON_ID=38269 /ORGANISM="Gloeochaete witrockiana, Strain SAG 46.84" /LENGTH=147 /DNA_ID=CAMNT_0027102793 /DNA_START=78 /DNA_END=517 /DNA_ORIENTATION=-